MAKINKRFDPEEHATLVHTSQYEGSCLCVFCGFIKPFSAFYPRHVARWQASPNPHRTGKCRACRRLSAKARLASRRKLPLERFFALWSKK